MEDIPPDTLLGSEDDNLDLDLKLDDSLSMEISVKNADFEDIPDNESIDSDDISVRSELNRTEIIKRPSNLPNSSDAKVSVA